MLSLDWLASCVFLQMGWDLDVDVVDPWSLTDVELDGALPVDGVDVDGVNIVDAVDNNPAPSSSGKAVYDAVPETAS